MATPWMFAVTVEAMTDDFAFAIAKANQGDLLLGRDRYVILDGKTLFPNDRLAFSRAEDVFGVQPQQGVASIAGLGMNTCWAIRIRPLTEGRHRILFFGLVGYRVNPVTIGPQKVGDGGLYIGSI